MLNTQLSQEWINWIQENLAKGCTHESIIQIMIEKGYAPNAAVRAVQTIHSQRGGPVNNINTTITSKSNGIKAANYTYENPRVPMDVNYIDTSDKRVYIGIRFNQPTILTFDNLLSIEEADQLIELTKPKLTESKVVDPTTGKDTKITQRKSEGTFFHLMENEFIATIDKRIAEVMHWPVINGEGLQILHYQPGGEYRAHFDYFPYNNPGSKIHLARGGQRVSTLIIYLSEVTQGGETTFPEIGLSIVPKKGAAVYFEYCNSKEEVDPLTLHAGMPVIKGSKWIATKWMRQHEYTNRT